MEKEVLHHFSPESREAPSAVFPSYISEGTRKALVELCTHVSEDRAEQAEFARKCMSYIQDFSNNYPELVEALFLGEELGGTKKQQRMQAKAMLQYSGTDIRRGELWNGAGEHTFAAALFAEIIATEMGLSRRSITRVTLAAGLHDWWKKNEVVHMWDAEDELAHAGTPLTNDTMESPEVYSVVRAQYDAAKKQDHTRLRKLGFSEEVIRLSSLNRLHDAEGPETPEELILFYVDHSLSGVRPTNIMDRIRAAVGKNPTYIAYEASFRQQLGGKTEHELLEEGLAEDIQRRIATYMKFTGDPQELPEHLVKLFIEAVQYQA
jgi:hypothetical protein